MATALKFRIKEEDGLYYLYIENNGAVHLCGYHTADLRLWFYISKIQVSRLIYSLVYTFICMDIQIGWQVSGTAGQQVGRYTCIRLYMSNCQHADLPLIQGLSYI